MAISRPFVELTVIALGLSCYGGAGLFILVVKRLGLSEQY